MTTTVVVVVREDRPDFHGRTAHIAVQGDGRPEQFAVAMKLAMEQAVQNLPDVWVGSRQGASGAMQASSAASSLVS